VSSFYSSAFGNLSLESDKSAQIFLPSRIAEVFTLASWREILFEGSFVTRAVSAFCAARVRSIIQLSITPRRGRPKEKGDPGYSGQLALTRTISAVTAACLAIRRTVFFEVGGLDEIHLLVDYNDVDLCLRLGDRVYRVVWTPFAELFHLESVSRGKDDTAEKQEACRREWQHLRDTWGSMLESADPFHNPNLLFRWDYLELPSVPRRERPWRAVFEKAFRL
jgi:hypothetical protein